MSAIFNLASDLNRGAPPNTADRVTREEFIAFAENYSVRHPPAFSDRYCGMGLGADVRRGQKVARCCCGLRSDGTPNRCRRNTSSLACGTTPRHSALTLSPGAMFSWSTKFAIDRPRNKFEYHIWQESLDEWESFRSQLAPEIVQQGYPALNAEQRATVDALNRKIHAAYAAYEKFLNCGERSDQRCAVSNAQQCCSRQWYHRPAARASKPDGKAGGRAGRFLRVSAGQRIHLHTNAGNVAGAEHQCTDPAGYGANA